MKEEEMNQIIELVDELIDDRSVPKNVRAVLVEIKEKLSEDGDSDIHIDSALAELEDLALDPNLSSHARMQILNLTSQLSAL